MKCEFCYRDFESYRNRKNQRCCGNEDCLRKKNKEARQQRSSYYSAYRRDNKEKISRKGREYSLRKTFDLSVDQVTEMYKSQKGKCPICLSKMIFLEKGPFELRACVDHNHMTGSIRGLLCRRCNRTLGACHDDPEIFRKAISYLRGL